MCIYNYFLNIKDNCFCKLSISINRSSRLDCLLYIVMWRWSLHQTTSSSSKTNLTSVTKLLSKLFPNLSWILTKLLSKQHFSTMAQINNVPPGVQLMLAAASEGPAGPATAGGGRGGGAEGARLGPPGSSRRNPLARGPKQVVGGGGGRKSSLRHCMLVMLVSLEYLRVQDL